MHKTPIACKRYQIHSLLKRNFLVFISFLLVCSYVEAQGSISPLWPDRGMVMRDQLWGFTFTNSQQESYMATIEMTVLDPVQGNVLYVAGSGQLLISPGINIVSKQKVDPVIYNNVSPAYRLNLSANTLLPPGIFNVCYRVNKIDGEVSGLQGEGCFTLESDPLTPPSLVLPADQDSIQTTRPFFNWLPLTPSESLAFLNYTIRVVEKDSLQSPQEAVERNVPVFLQTQIQQNFCAYPSTISQLDSNKQYAWQVIAYNDISYVAASECWQFCLAKNLNEEALDIDRPYMPMVREGMPGLIRVEKVLKLKYINESGDSTLDFHIEEQGVSVPVEEESDLIYSIPASGGDNYIMIDADKLEGIKRNRMYVVYLLNSRGERWQLNFILID